MLIVGVEPRILNLNDIKIVARDAFGIVNFVFRSKKIDFDIPDKWLLLYLCQRQDFTKFLIDVTEIEDVVLDTAFSAGKFTSSDRCRLRSG